jgi:hypothetical protein
MCKIVQSHQVVWSYAMHVSAGEKIVCLNGHVCGLFLNAVEPFKPIQARDFRVVGGLHNIDGFICDACGETITRRVGGHWQVRTVLGWAGQVEEAGSGLLAPHASIQSGRCPAPTQRDAGSINGSPE